MGHKAHIIPVIYMSLIIKAPFIKKAFWNPFQGGWKSEIKCSIIDTAKDQSATWVFKTLKGTRSKVADVKATDVVSANIGHFQT